MKDDDEKRVRGNQKQSNELGRGHQWPPIYAGDSTSGRPLLVVGGTKLMKMNRAAGGGGGGAESGSLAQPAAAAKSAAVESNPGDLVKAGPKWIVCSLLCALVKAKIIEQNRIEQNRVCVCVCVGRKSRVTRCSAGSALWSSQIQADLSAR